MKQTIVLKEDVKKFKLENRLNELLIDDDDFILKITQNYYTIFFLTSNL